MKKPKENNIKKPAAAYECNLFILSCTSHQIMIYELKLTCSTGSLICMSWMQVDAKLPKPE